MDGEIMTENLRQNNQTELELQCELKNVTFSTMMLRMLYLLQMEISTLIHIKITLLLQWTKNRLFLLKTHVNIYLAYLGGIKSPHNKFFLSTVIYVNAID